MCNVSFTDTTILKHISHSKTCKKSYTKNELFLLKDWAKEKKVEKKKNSYDPEKRRANYLKLKSKIKEAGQDKVNINTS